MMLSQRDGDEPFQARRLELILAEPGEGPAKPDNPKTRTAALAKEDRGPDDVEVSRQAGTQ